jgi:hypothetical protein
LFVESFDYPLAYLSVNALDRSYKLEALRTALCFEVPEMACLDAARIYGSGHVPKNTISFLISWASERLAETDYHFLTTAVNPMLGFTGTSMLAAGFRPYALCPVAYGYDTKGEYATRRNNPVCAARLHTPPNILFVKGLSRAGRRRVKKLATVHSIPAATHHAAWRSLVSEQTSHRLEATVERLREELEQAWNNLTRYHRTAYSPDDPISKGQCGVTSAYIARELQKQGQEVLFCEGDVSFPGNVQPIKNHCWVKLPSFGPANRQIRDVIIDLTADQSGFEEQVICETDLALKARGIHYHQAREVEPRVVDAGHLWHLSDRLNTLQQRIQTLSTS